MDQTRAEELVRRMATALRGTELYSPTHSLVQRAIDGLTAAATEARRPHPAADAEMPALASIVAFEHHLKQDLSGYPEKIRPQVKILTDKTGAHLEAPLLVNTWERDSRGEQLRAVVEAVDPEPLAIDPLTYL
jgi:hypothetical protein